MSQQSLNPPFLLGRIRDQLLEFARFSKQHPLGLLSPTVDIFRWLEVTLQRCLPDNAHTLARGRLHISMTRISDGKNVIVSEFNSSDELINVSIMIFVYVIQSNILYSNKAALINHLQSIMVNS